MQKYLPTSTATIKGHLRRTRQNIRSTKNKPAAIPADTTQDMSPTQEINAACELFCFAALADANDKTIYTDLAGKFTVRSYSGQQYIFLAYVYDSNAILVRPMKNREKGSVIEAFKSIYNYLSERNFKPKLHVMDNEISKDIEQYITDQKTKFNLSNRTNTESMLRKELFKHTRITLYLGSAQSIHFFPYNCGTNYCHSPKILSFSYEHPAQTTNYQHMPPSRVNLISTKRPWHRPEQNPLSMLIPNNA